MDQSVYNNVQKDKNYTDDFFTPMDSFDDKNHREKNKNINEIDTQNNNEGKINETVMESKIKQLSGKNQNILSENLLSEKVINKDELRASMENIGIISTEKVEYIELRKMPKISENEFEELKSKFIEKDTLQKLNDTLEKVVCDFKSTSCNNTIGGISPLTYLVESAYSAKKENEKEMWDVYNKLKKYIYNYRTIRGDGNCFYRAVMFRYLEILILNNNIEQLQNFVSDVVNSFKSEELNLRRNISGMDIKPELTYKILILIIDLLKKNKKESALKILVKSFITSKKFDYAIIFYFRYILYDYIKKNENKTYSKTFPIKLGNLLPSQFETADGKFLFNEFYEKFLLHFFTDAEKIIIYLTPIVIGIELNVIIFDDKEEEILQKFKWEDESDIKSNDIIYLLNRKNHYELTYTKDDYEKNKNFFQSFISNQISVFLSEEKKMQKVKDDSEINRKNLNNNLKNNELELKNDKIIK